MGIISNDIKYMLLMNKRYGIDFSKIAMLGRQNLFINDQEDRELLRYFNINVDTLKQEDGYAENFFRNLSQINGIDGAIESFDASSYENATNICDMNLPINEKYEGKYSFVFDGGTLEHVFQYPTALHNAMKMCQMNGYLMLITPANNYNGHGFYQFSPELFFNVLGKNGFQIMDITYRSEINGELFSVKISEPEKSGRRIGYNIGNFAFLCVFAKRIGFVPEKLCAQQSDYYAKWNGNEPKESKKDTFFYNLDEELQKVFFDKKVNSKIKCKINAVLWGAGNECTWHLRQGLLQNSNRVEIKMIVDRNPNKWGMSIEKIKIATPESLRANNVDMVVITTNESFFNDIYHQLICEYGFSEEQIFSIDEFEYYIMTCNG